MRIIRLNVAEFGCLKDKSFEFGDGLNIINGDNSSGKSTVALFIKFMFYGLPRRSSKSYDRERSLSFSGHRAEGSMELERDGRRYRVERRAVAASRVSETVKVICLDTGEELSGEPWELFLGVSGDVFESSASVAQMGAASISKSGAEGAMENMLSSADESVDVSAALDRIDAVRKLYKLNRGEGGLLYESERRLSELGAEYRGAADKYLKGNSMRARLERKQAELEAAKAELEAAEHGFERIRDARILRRFDSLEVSVKKENAVSEEIRALEKSFCRGGYIPVEGHADAIASARTAHGQAVARLEEKKRLYADATASAADGDGLAAVGESIEKAGGKEKVLSAPLGYHGAYRTRRALGALLMGVGAALLPLAALLFVFVGVLAAVVSAGVGAVALAVGVAFAVSARKSRIKRDGLCAEFGKAFEELDGYLSLCLERLSLRRSRAEAVITAEAQAAAAEDEETRARESLRCVLLKTADSVPHDSDGLWRTAEAEISRTEEFCARRRELDRKIYELQAVIRAERTALAEYDEAELRQSFGDSVLLADAASYSEAERSVRFCRAKQASLNAEVGTLRESLAAYGAGMGRSPAEIGDEINETKRGLEADTDYFEALMLAKECIEEASLSMSGNVTPELSRRAGELLASVSGGRHRSAQTTKSLDISVEQDGFNLPCELLSGGTRDAAYICLRVALMTRLFGAELPPLMLDESLCQFDDKRAEAMLGLLSRLSETGLQTLLFSCHSRETEICARKDYKFNRIVI